MSKKSTRHSFRSLSEMSLPQKIVFLIAFLFIFAASQGVAIYGMASGNPFPFILLLLASMALSVFSFIMIIASIIQGSNDKKAVQKPVPAREQPVHTQSPPPAPKRIPKEYHKPLQALARSLDNVKQRGQVMNELVNDSFAGSFISQARYNDVLREAVEVLEQNMKSATQAAEIFSLSAVTDKRIEILNAYVADSEDVVEKIDRVIDGLLQLRQSSTLSDGDQVDSRLDELAQTTALYQHAGGGQH